MWSGGALIYRKLYFMLFNTIPDALQEIETMNFGTAAELPRKAQMAAEEKYISEEAPILPLSNKKEP